MFYKDLLKMHTFANDKTVIYGIILSSKLLEEIMNLVNILQSDSNYQMKKDSLNIIYFQHLFDPIPFIICLIFR